MDYSDRLYNSKSFNEFESTYRTFYCGCQNPKRDGLENRLTRKRRVKAGIMEVFGCTPGQAAVMAVNYIGDAPVRTRRCKMCGSTYVDRKIASGVNV